MIWLLRYGMVTLVAATMSVVGLQLMFHFPAVWQFDSLSFGLVLPSVLLWSVLVSVVRRTTIVGAAALGLLSPVIGGFLVAGPTGLGFVLSCWYVTFVTGAVTGILVHRCLLLGSEAKPGVAGSRA